MKTKLKIHEKRGGKIFKSHATPESIELVKKLYHAMKREKIFSKYQKVCLPLRGLDRFEETQAVAKVSHLLPHERCYDLNKFIYIPSNQSDNPPGILREILLIEKMLVSYINYDEYTLSSLINRSYLITPTEILGVYLKCYYSDNLKKKKIILTDLAFEFIFGIIGSVLSVFLFFYLASLIMPTGFSTCFGFMTLFFGVVSFFFLKNES